MHVSPLGFPGVYLLCISAFFEWMGLEIPCLEKATASLKLDRRLILSAWSFPPGRKMPPAGCAMQR